MVEHAADDSDYACCSACPFGLDPSRIVFFDALKFVRILGSWRLVNGTHELIKRKKDSERRGVDEASPMRLNRERGGSFHRHTTASILTAIKHTYCGPPRSWSTWLSWPAGLFSFGELALKLSHRIDRHLLCSLTQREGLGVLTPHSTNIFRRGVVKVAKQRSWSRVGTHSAPAEES